MKNIKLKLLALPMLVVSINSFAALEWTPKVSIKTIQSEAEGHAVYTTENVGLGCQSNGTTLRLGFYNSIPANNVDLSESRMSQILFAMGAGKDMEFRIETNGGLCFIHQVKLHN